MDMQIKNCLYINNEDFTLTELPDFIKKKAIESLDLKKKVIIFTDSIYNNSLKDMFGEFYKFLNENINYKNLIIEVFDCEEFSLKYPLQFIINTYNSNNNLFIIWDIKNIVKDKEHLHIAIDSFANILNLCKFKNIENLLYIQNRKYDFEFFYEFCKNFQRIVVYNNNKDLIFDDKDEFYKLINFICSYAELKHQNENLVLFNNTMSNIPMGFHKDDFKENIMSQLIRVCQLSFCCLYTSSKEHENIISLDKCYGITKIHRYYLFNDIDFIKFQQDINKYIMSSGKSLNLCVDYIKNKVVKDKFVKLNIKSLLGISIQYHNDIKGVMWVGRYEDNIDNIDNMDKDISYIESMCKTMFCLIQEQKKFFNLKNKFIENEKLRAMGEIAAGIAHDINNILTPIIGSVQLLKDKYFEDNIIQKQLKVIEMCAYDATNIINKLKKITKSSNNNEVHIFNVNEIIIDAISLTKNKWFTESILNGIKINISTNLNSKEKIQGNITEIREVIINIISNAVDAIKEVGSIDIFTKDEDNFVIIEIKDNGVGINDEIGDRIFEPFFTTKGKKGSGLGLSIAYEIIQSIGGVINCKSAKDIGTKFQIKLPICNIKKITYNKQLKKHFEYISKNVLVIDDNMDVRNILFQIIKSVTKCKVKVLNPIDINEVEKELKKRKYDIVICDFSMPNVNGIEIAKKVKEINSDTYFCLMTGWIGTLNEASMKFIDEILNKPLTKETIQDFFNRYENICSLD
ncbi:histidine kinase [Clostridium novyi B str. ATCC 27606]|uniref:Stage 0 sporulation protein A homolog n=4 Tax=Clostridium TaxID=1485 RepID=A0AA40M4S9_CLONO|nr:histidine kinase [Clostridium novyi B str. NCTC 9691]KEI13689.1 histidine kinase [Clostridium novyi B str. ATCC 27606]